LEYNANFRSCRTFTQKSSTAEPSRSNCTLLLHASGGFHLWLGGIATDGMHHGAALNRPPERQEIHTAIPAIRGAPLLHAWSEPMHFLRTYARHHARASNSIGMSQHSKLELGERALTTRHFALDTPFDLSRAGFPTYVTSRAASLNCEFDISRLDVVIIRLAVVVMLIISDLRRFCSRMSSVVDELQLSDKSGNHRRHILRKVRSSSTRRDDGLGEMASSTSSHSRLLRASGALTPIDLFFSHDFVLAKK